MERTVKTWGDKWNIFQNDLCEVSVLYLKPNERCSWHSHTSKYNLFFVISGKLVIKVDEYETTVLPGQILTTKPFEMHEFQTRSLDTICIEVMYTQYDPEDIDRKDVGGPIGADD